MARSTDKRARLTRGIGFCLGIAVVAVLLVGWRMPAGSGRLGLDLRIVTSPSGELGVTPSGPIAAGEGLEPRTGHAAVAGATVVRNQTGSTLAVTARVLPPDRDLDRIVLVALRADGRPLYSGSLGALRSGAAPLRLRPGRSVRLAVRAWLAPTTDGSYRGRIADVPLDLRTRVVER